MIKFSNKTLKIKLLSVIDHNNDIVIHQKIKRIISDIIY